jgi:hypothetical protein
VPVARFIEVDELDELTEVQKASVRLAFNLNEDLERMKLWINNQESKWNWC